MLGKTIVLGVTGGIAAYKAAALCSSLTQKGADVRVIMTRSACEFVQPLTFQALSRHPVYVETFEEKDPSVIAHIDLADSADLIVIAPATANVIGKLANGIADDMLTTTVLAARAPVMIAPAMNVHMYRHPAVEANIRQLQAWGVRFIEPGEGPLACGYVGKGRLAEPEEIVAAIEAFFRERQDLSGFRFLVTAGATREKLDPVRYFTNRSTGKMGYAIARAAAERGADVTLVSGKTSLTPPAGVKLVEVESAQEMFEAVLSRMDEADVIVKAAAVADYRPAVVYEQKLKKKEGTLTVEMERTPDILQTLGERKTRQFLVGFAAETENVEEHARSKLLRKNLDLIVANDVTQPGAGFESETNIVTVFDANGEVCRWPCLSKAELAHRLLDLILQKRASR
ncbi:bifunctional phosphopantothenoylcysteine decarboxylase/phosphopantothenate--cysteine ligase CoaBC [Bacillaceae bacterium]